MADVNLVQVGTKRLETYRQQQRLFQASQSREDYKVACNAKLPVVLHSVQTAGQGIAALVFGDSKGPEEYSFSA